ncbi:MAG: dihydrolipoyl dehydrogenase [Candidatus Bathyarchaeia archaeon]
MSKVDAYDVAIIGAGIGGYVSAIRCSQLGMRVALIERWKVGGVCLNKGCIPTAVLLNTVNLLEKIRRAKDYGVTIESFSVDLREVRARKEAVVDRLSRGVRYLLEKNKVEFIDGVGRIKLRNRVVVERDGEERVVEAKNIVVASGSRPRQLPNIPVDGSRIITVEDALDLEEVPENIFIIGGGIMGVEFAQIFRSLGANVAILEKRQSLLPSFDREVGATLRRIFERSGIKVFTSVSSESASVRNGRVNLAFHAGGGKVDAIADKVIVAVGRRPNVENLGLENVGVRLKDGFIEVDGHMRTNVPNIYAVGDVVGGKMFAHSAFAEGLVAAENIAGLETEFDWRTIPVCVYTTPEIASVGLTEEEAVNLGYKVSVGKFPYMANGKALALGEREGFVKLIAREETDEILGVHIIGPDASNMISEATVAMRLECTSEELGRTVHPHPTLSEAIMEAALAVFGRAIHV